MNQEANSIQQYLNQKYGLYPPLLGLSALCKSYQGVPGIDLRSYIEQEILRSDLTKTCCPNEADISKIERVIPKNVFDNRSTQILGPLLLQVISVRNISVSRNEQLQHLQDKNSSVLHDIPDENQQSARLGQSKLKSHVYKLLLQDCFGRFIWGVEYGSRFETVCAGSKVKLLKAEFRRGVLIIDDNYTIVELIQDSSIKEWNLGSHEELKMNQLRQELGISQIEITSTTATTITDEFTENIDFSDENIVLSDDEYDIN
ncbi:uncharacterized protein V1516DRAFT_664717 [Lipomyces oligophaga]|uniref:uncharacterized protein n=1 Tax=Lipomyces oligophaga TaxID=45792 RepID=UPI0034CE674C